MPIQQPNRSIPPRRVVSTRIKVYIYIIKVYTYIYVYVAFQPSSRDTFVGRATKACLRIPMSTVRKDERDVAVFAFAFARRGRFYE